jgi:hypothetical protein
VNLVPALPAALAGTVLLLVPGLALLALLGARDRDALQWDEQVFLAVVTSVMASAWVALLLAEAGRFAMIRAALLLLAASLVALALGRRRAAWPLRLPRRAGEAIPALSILAIAFALHARPTEYLLGGRDPGTYIASMGLIARSGGIAYLDPAVLSIPPEAVELFYRNPQAPDFSWGRFMGFPLERPETGRVLPEFFHLFPAFGAYLFQAMGVKGALATPPLFGILGTLAAFLALRRLFGPAPALLAALLLAVNEVQVWFARCPVSEGVSQLLIFTAFLAIALWEERGSAALGALAGVALGLSLLVRIDSVLLLLPIGLYLLVRRAHGELSWRSALPLLLPIALLGGHAALHATIWARKYIVSIASRPYWQQPAGVWVALGLLALAALSAAGHFGPRLLRVLEAHGAALRTGLTAAVILLALYAYFLRPALSAWAGADGNHEALRLADPGWLRALGFHKLAAHDAQAFYRLGWFLTPVGLWLAVLGLLLAIRDFRARYLFPLATLAAFAGFYLYKIRIYNDYYFAMRRFVPVILPLALGLAALALQRLAARGGPRRALAGTLALALLAAYLHAGWPLRRYTDWKNAVRFVEDVARRFSPRDIVIFEQVQSIHLLSLPLWAVHGVNILELARFNPDPDRLRQLVEAWRGRYDNIYFVHTYRTDLCGLFLQRVVDYSFGSFEWERAYGRRPEKPEFRALHFTVSRVVPPEQLQVPPLDSVDIGGSDDFQVSGFFAKEGGGEHTFRWTGSCASVYLPGARPGATLRVAVSRGARPDAARVSASLSGVELGGFVAEPDWSEHALALPEPLPAGPPVLRLDVKAFRPANALPDSADMRDLGVMLDSIRIEAR